ncbi:PhnD/SsuA/transferrin family substrate-binding protein [Tolypothrix bouteillei VB521301]|uniref:PhnD/SsuA/transferrin family substrate-binding protein n=1 Tax=Tolypothrix bouteillei VB521301 TaxID=1479485 RepID=A0A0C1N2S0_9CYAN|nr:PhnD/SsuA/transferrin family substrate-binding protein [Tolypothrix bouteillei VB521301]
MEDCQSQVANLQKLRAVSYLAPNLFHFYQAVVAYAGRVLGVATQLHQGECDPLDDPLLVENQLDLAFICGLPLIRYCQVVPDWLQVLVAPVMKATRYQNYPIYFSDVIVNAASDLTKFEDLALKSFGYNDLGSNSGYNLLCDRLIQTGHSKKFFRKAIQSGSHQRSIEWVLNGRVDCAAIDSVVLEQELRQFPELSHQLRVVEVLGPSPMPPLVVAQHLGKSLIEQLQFALLQPDTELQSVMEEVGVRRFAVVELEEYKVLVENFSSRKSEFL